MYIKFFEELNIKQQIYQKNFSVQEEQVYT